MSGFGEWIDVSCEKPDDGLVVLVAAPKASEPVWLGYYDSSEPCWYYECGIPIQAGLVTHWIELPELPKAVTDGNG
jgi:hypothetical protein